MCLLACRTNEHTIPIIPQAVPLPPVAPSICGGRYIKYHRRDSSPSTSPSASLLCRLSACTRAVRGCYLLGSDGTTDTALSWSRVEFPATWPAEYTCEYLSCGELNFNWYFPSLLRILHCTTPNSWVCVAYVEACSFEVFNMCANHRSEYCGFNSAEVFRPFCIAPRRAQILRIAIINQFFFAVHERSEWTMSSHIPGTNERPTCSKDTPFSQPPLP